MNTNTINGLHDRYLANTMNTLFWRDLDTIEPVVLCRIGDVLLNARVLSGSDYQQVASIIHQYKTCRDWTDKQRRSVAMSIITYWRDIDWRLE